MRINSLEELNIHIIACQKCSRLVTYLKQTGEKKVKRFKNDTYWAKPVPSFGDPSAKILILGLAPGAHGANRTGRIFSGDKSGQWLYKALFDAGLSNQAYSSSVNDGLKLRNVWISNVIHCVPPQNKPLKEEISACHEFLETEIKLIKNLTTILCLGKIAFDECKKLYKLKGAKFAHGTSFKVDNLSILCSYHPSQQNTQTGRLTWEMWADIFDRIK